MCYESHPPPIQSGCGCRAGNELVHPECLVKFASFNHVHRGRSIWDVCQTCKRSFGGTIRNLLAIAKVLHVTNPHNHLHWFVEMLPAIRNALYLSECLIKKEQYEEAEQITRALLGPIKRLFGHRDILYLQCGACMALSQTFTGKYSESNWRFVNVIRTLASVYCLDDWMTLSVRLQYTASLLRQLRTAESHNITRYVLRAIRRVFGEHHVTAMACIANLATSISLVVNTNSFATSSLVPGECDGCTAKKMVVWNVGSGVLSYRCTTAWCRQSQVNTKSYVKTGIMMRVMDGMSNLAKSLLLHAQFAEAESLNTALLAVQEIVLGKSHQQTIETHNNITACKVARRTQVARRTRRVQKQSERRDAYSDKLQKSRRAEMMTRRRLVTTRTTATNKAPHAIIVGAMRVPSHGNVDSENYACSYTYTYTHTYHHTHPDP